MQISEVRHDLAGGQYVDLRCHGENKMSVVLRLLLWRLMNKFLPRNCASVPSQVLSRTKASAVKPFWFTMWEGGLFGRVENQSCGDARKVYLTLFARDISSEHIVLAVLLQFSFFWRSCFFPWHAEKQLHPPCNRSLSSARGLLLLVALCMAGMIRILFFNHDAPSGRQAKCRTRSPQRSAGLTGSS